MDATHHPKQGFVCEVTVLVYRWQNAKYEAHQYHHEPRKKHNSIAIIRTLNWPIVTSITEFVKRGVKYAKARFIWSCLRFSSNQHEIFSLTSFKFERSIYQIFRDLR